MSGKPLILPRPRQAEFQDQTILLASDAVSHIRLKAAQPLGEVAGSALKLLTEKLKGFGCLGPMEGAYPITLSVDPQDALLAAHDVRDAYAIRIGEDGAALVGRDEGGLYYAAVTFLQLVHIENSRVSVPICTIVDWPSFPTRGLFIEDRYGSDFLTREDWFRAVDYFAGMKYNQLTVGIYGCWCQQYDGMISEYLYVPFKTHPELKTPRNVRFYSPTGRKWIREDGVLPVMFRDDYFGELVAYAKKRNIRVQPLINSYGHNTLFPRLMPEISAKDEQGNDTGFGLCISDERTYQRMFELYDEIVDRYLLPNGVDSLHLGLDEVWEGIGMDATDPFRFHTPFCKCENCRRRERSDLMIDYVIRIAKHLKEKGLRHVCFYYDMFFNIFKVLNESMWKRFVEAGVDDVAVVDWWDYSSEDGLFPGRPLDTHFRGITKPITGYYHWSTPVEYLSNIRGAARIAKEYAHEGLEGYSSYEKIHDRSYWMLADFAWNVDMAEDPEAFLCEYAELRFPDGGPEVPEALSDLAEIEQDNFMHGSIPRNRLLALDYYTYSYVNGKEPYPRRFPEEAFEKIHQDREAYEKYFADVRAKALRARKCFEREARKQSGDAEIKASWTAIAMHYEVVADEYLSLMTLEQERDAGRAEAELERMLENREALMARVEATRIEANRFLYLRNMSIYRQVLLDLLDAARACRAAGRPFELDMTHLEGIKTDMLNHYLR